MCALTQPEARNEPVVLGKQLCCLPIAPTSWVSAVPFLAGVGHEISKGGATLIACFPSDLLRFYLMASSRKLPRGRTLEASGGLGLMWPAFHPTPDPCTFPSPFLPLPSVCKVGDYIFGGFLFIF